MQRSRILISLLAGAGAGLAAFWFQYTSEYARYWANPAGDFWWILRAADDLLAGRNPYAYPPGVLSFLYPLPAALMGVPFVWLPWHVAGAVFLGCSVALMSWGLLAQGERWRLLALLSCPFWQCVTAMQWTPLIVAFAASSWLLPLLIMKPHAALSVALLRPPRRLGLALFGLVLLVSFALIPNWVILWRQQVTEYRGFIPLLTPIGAVLLLFLLRWRDNDARFVLTMAAMPQHLYLYDQLLLWLVLKNWRQMACMNIFSWVSFFICQRFGFNYGIYVISALLYIPVLVFLMPKSGIYRWILGK